MDVGVLDEVRADVAVALEEGDEPGEAVVQPAHDRGDDELAGERHDLRRLHHDGVAGDQRGDGEQDDLLDRVVPRRADRDDAVGVAHDHRAAVHLRLVRLLHQRNVLVHVGVVRHLRLRLAQRLPHLLRDQPRERVGARLGDPPDRQPHELRALRQLERRPARLD